MSFFVPDRSNRPTDDDDPTGGTGEVASDRTKTKALADGRVAVVEAASVDGITMIYYYFDMQGLDEAGTDALRELLERSGVGFAPFDDDVEVSFSSSKTEDAQGRRIWEFQVAYW